MDRWLGAGCRRQSGPLHTTAKAVSGLLRAYFPNCIIGTTQTNTRFSWSLYLLLFAFTLIIEMLIHLTHPFFH